MAGIGGIGGLGGILGGGMPGAGGTPGLGGLGDIGGIAGGEGGGGLGASKEGDSNFADVLREIVIDRPSEAHQASSQLGMEAAAGGNVDTHQLAIASALAGVEIQMSTRVISSAVSGLRTLLQMQI